MLISIVSLGLVGTVLLVSEYLWRTNRFHSESSRKFVHIIVGTFIATWGFFMTKQQIQVLSLVLLVGVLLSMKLSLFSSVHGVSRRTWGEPLFAATIGIVATITSSEYIFAAAILHLSLADGLAAIIGVKYGGKTGYKLFGHYKTLIGSLVFYVTSLSITAWVIMYGPSSFGTHELTLLLGLPIVTTVAENLAVNGMDNLVVPMIVVVVLEFIESLPA